MSADESVTNYFSYVKNVLGVRQLYSERFRESLVEVPEVEPHHRGTPWSEVPKIGYDLLFVNLWGPDEASVFSGESSGLLEKMIQAMRLGARRSIVLEAQRPDRQESSALHPLIMKFSETLPRVFVVFLSSSPAANGVVKTLGTVRYMETFAPSYLLKNPAAKKVAWIDLQKVMKEFGIL